MKPCRLNPMAATILLIVVALVTLPLLAENSKQRISSTSDPLTTTDLPDRIADLYIPTQPFERNASFASWILEIEEDKVADWLRQTTQPDWPVSPTVRREVQTLLVRRLAATQPEKALAFALDRVGSVQSSLISAVFQEWAQLDLDDALEHASALNNIGIDDHWAGKAILDARPDLSPEQRRKIEVRFEFEFGEHELDYDSLIQEQIRSPKMAWYAMLEHSEPNVRHYSELAAVATTWIGIDGTGVLHEINSSLKNELIRKNVLLRTLKNLVDTQPQQALATALKLQFPGRNAALLDMVGEWADDDPIAAFNAVAVLPRTPFRKALEARILDEWTGKYPWPVGLSRNDVDPQAMLDSLDQLPKSVRGQVSSTAIGRMARDSSPAQAADRVLQLEPRLQPAAARVLVEQWVKKDQAAVVEWVSTHPELETFRGTLLNALAWALVDNDARLAFEVALKQPIPYHGFGLEGEILADIAGDDITLAMELLPYVREGTTEANAYLSVAKRLLRKNRTTEIVELGKQLTESSRRGYFIHISTDWARKDPQGLIDAISGFPSIEIRTFIATLQYHSTDSTSIYTEEQRESLREYFSTKEQRESLPEFLQQ